MTKCKRARAMLQHVEQNCRAKAGESGQYFRLFRDDAGARIRSGDCKLAERDLRWAIRYARCSRGRKPPGVMLGRGR